jgi:hypothetical protein
MNQVRTYNRYQEEERRGARETQPLPFFRRHPKLKVGLIAGAVVLLAAVLLVALFAWNRWFAHDDAADFEGTWYVAGVGNTITIQDGTIRLTDDVSYPYVLNTDDKTLTFSFAGAEGAGCYRFSLDRQQLALVDGTYSGAQTLMNDLEWLPGAVLGALTGNTVAPGAPALEGTIVFTRTPVTSDELAKMNEVAAGSATTADTYAGSTEEEALEGAADISDRKQE